MNRPHGASVVELMVALAIVSILAAIAAPNFADLLASQRLRGTVHALSEALAQARLAAMARADTVLVAPNDGDWQAGWSIFVDSDGDFRPGPADETLARKGALAPGTVVLMGFSVPDRDGYIAFGPAGRSCRANAAELPRWGTITVASGAHKRRIKVSFLGRHRVCDPALEKEGCDGPDP
jgi:type IV fimbrial biogenesis protein FimT